MARRWDSPSSSAQLTRSAAPARRATRARSESRSRSSRRSRSGSGAATAACSERVRLELNHAARDLALLEIFERVVHLVQLDALGDQVVEVQAALEVEVDEAGHVHAERVGAHVRALDALLEQEIDSVELHLG